MMKRVMIDGGFRDGVYTEAYLKDNPDSTMVFAFEPYQINRPKAEELSVKYPNSCVSAMEDALWVKEGTLDFYPATRMDGGSLLDNMKHRADREPIQVRCLDLADFINDYIRSMYPGCPIHIKLDIEGAEYAVINHLLDRKAIAPIDELVVEFHTRQNRSLREAHDMLIERLELNHIKYTNWK